MSVFDGEWGRVANHILRPVDWEATFLEETGEKSKMFLWDGEDEPSFRAVSHDSRLVLWL